VTGFSYFGEALSAKRIEVLRKMLPEGSVLGIRHNVADPVFREWGVQTEATVHAQAMQPVRLGLRSNSPAETTELLRSLRGQGGGAVIVISAFLTATLKDEIISTRPSWSPARLRGADAQWWTWPVRSLFLLGPE